MPGTESTETTVQDRRERKNHEEPKGEKRSINKRREEEARTFCSPLPALVP
jgi:hypothetical protein